MVLATLPIIPQAAPIIALVAAITRVANEHHWRYGGRAVAFTLAASPFAAGIVAVICLLAWPNAPVALILAAPAYCLTIVVARALIPPPAGDDLPLLAFREALWSMPVVTLFGGTGILLGLLYGRSGLLSLIACGVPIVILRIVMGYVGRQNSQELVAAQAARAETEEAHDEKERGLRELIGTLATLVDARDQAVAGHSTRVARYAVALGEILGSSPRELAYLHTAGLLHDVGKIGVSEAILLKPGKLSPEEYATVREHAAIGERLLARVGSFAEVAKMVGDHHEHFDGGGYPCGESGEAITHGGRILAIADALDTILSDHPYSRGHSIGWALAELDRHAGTQFDPTIVEAAHRLVTERSTEFFDSETLGAHEEIARGGLVVHFPRERDTSPSAAHVAWPASANDPIGRLISGRR